MTVRSKRDLIYDVLISHFRIIEPGEDASADDYNFAEQKYTDLLAEFAEFGVSYFPANEIPPAVFERLSEVIASRCGSAYGIAYTLEMREYLLTQLKKHTARQKSDLPVPGLYF